MRRAARKASSCGDTIVRLSDAFPEEALIPVWVIDDIDGVGQDARRTVRSRVRAPAWIPLSYELDPHAVRRVGDGLRWCIPDARGCVLHVEVVEDKRNLDEVRRSQSAVGRRSGVVESVCPSGAPTGLPVLVLVIGIAFAVLANWIIATAALAAGASGAFAPLMIYVYGPFTVLGLLAAYIGWRFVRRRARHPAAALRVLVPAITVLSFAPDTILALTRFIPGTSVAAVIALALMHVVVVAIAIPVCARLAPVN